MKYINLHSRTYIWKCHLQNVGQFFSGLNVLWILYIVLPNSLLVGEDMYNLTMYIDPIYFFFPDNSVEYLYILMV